MICQFMIRSDRLEMQDPISFYINPSEGEGCLSAFLGVSLCEAVGEWGMFCSFVPRQPKLEKFFVLDICNLKQQFSAGDNAFLRFGI